MRNHPSSDESELPVCGEDSDVRYTLDVFAELAGVSPHTVLHYQEKGFIRAASRDPAAPVVFDAECLRQLRRIEYLRSTYQVNEAGLKLILDLLRENERLCQERRQTLR